MEGFIVMLLLAILALPIILLIWVKTSTGSLIREVLLKLNHLSKKVDQLQYIKEEVKLEPEQEDEKVVVNESLLNLMEELPLKEKKVEPKPELKKKVEEVIPAIKKIVKEIETPITEKKSEIVEIVKKVKERKEEEKRKSKKAVFTMPTIEKRNMEQFIGENLINKIGIGILVLGIAYFVNFAIDNNWISQVGRIAIGFLSGGLLTLIAHKIRKSYKAFSSVLVGGAMAVFYYTISIGFHEYQQFSQPVAFILMVVVTAFSVLLSISYDKKTLAILGLIGAFSTPLMLSNGAGNYQVLFSYIAIVNVGMLVLAYFKKWNVVNILAFAFTVVLYGAWFVTSIVEGFQPPYSGALFFAALFYVIFFFMHIVNNVKEKRKFKGYEFGLMLATTALFYGVGMITLHLSDNDNMRGLFTVGLGIFNLLFAFPLFKRNSVDKSLIYLLIGMVLTFISLAAPVQLSGNYITLFWATEMVLLLWLAQKSGIQFMKISSLVILGLMLISLVMDWQQIYLDHHDYTLAVIFNKGFITTAFSLLGIVAYNKLLNNETDTDFLTGFKVGQLQITVKIMIAALLYFIGFFEVAYQVGHRFTYSPLTTLSIAGYSYLYLLGLMSYAQKSGKEILTLGVQITAALAVLTYPLFNEVTQVIRADYLFGETYFTSFALQYVLLALIVVIGVKLILQIRKTYGLRSDIGKMAVLGMSLIGLVVASTQLNHHTLLFFFDNQTNNLAFINNQTIKIGYPIVWGLASFVMMMLGMKYQYKPLRIISLSVFSLLLLKLFLFDIKGASEAGKIVAFILLGVLLLVISFMYQKLKKLLIDDQSSKK